MTLASYVIVFWLGFAVAVYVTRQTRAEREDSMSLSDCPKCWDTPCTCGHEYKSWSVARLEQHIEMLQKVLEEVKKEEINKSSLQP